MKEKDEINIKLGSVTAFFHVAGYTFQRAATELKWLLEDGRFRKAGDGFKDVNEFLDIIQLGKLKAAAGERKELAQLIKQLQPEASNRRIAKALGTSATTVRRDTAPNGASVSEKNEQNQKEMPPTTAPNGAPPLTGDKVARLAEQYAKKQQSAERAEQRRAESKSAKPLPDGMDLRIGDCRTVLADIADNSVALVLTDPPYAEESEPLYKWLAEWSARVLLPGGSLICYTGHWSVNRDMRIFDAHLRYWWLLAMMHHQSQRLPGKFIIANFKPVLWYVKQSRRGKTLVPDVLRPPAREKEEHDWGQGEGGVTDLIHHLTDPGEIIADPFAGTATWGRIATNLGRRWIGADIVTGGTTRIAAE